MRRWTVRASVTVLVLAVLTLAAGESYRIYRQSRIRQWSRISLEIGVESLERIALGNAEQWILIRGQNAANPVLLWLHGGPGMPTFSWVRRLGLEAGLEHDFTVVYWEQRGTGKSAAVAANPDAIHLANFVSDICELGEMLRARFRKPVYLAGHSWGTIFGLVAVQKCPELFQAYAGISQFANVFEQERRATAFLLQEAERSGNREAIDAIQRLGKPPYGVDKAVDQRRWLGEFLGIDARHPPSHWRDFQDAAQSPEYSFIDLMRISFDPYRARRLLEPELVQVNFLAAPLTVKVPLWLLQGRKDALCQPALAEQLFQHIQAPAGKELVWFDNVAHLLPLEEPDGLRKTMQRMRNGAMKPAASPVPEKPSRLKSSRRYQQRPQP
jgi:pimeloyl-ACP methyl ester carboxylesterase